MNCEPCTEHPLAVKLKKLQSHEIIESIGRFLDVRPDQIKGKTRWKNIAEARQICCFVLRSDRYLDMSLASIGFVLGKRHHTTVIYAVKTIEGYLEVDEYFREKMKDLYLDVYGTLKYFPEFE